MLPFLITPIAFVTWCVGIAKARATVLQVSKALFVMLFIAGVLWTAFGFPATLRICGASRAVPVAIQCLLPLRSSRLRRIGETRIPPTVVSSCTGAFSPGSLGQPCLGMANFCNPAPSNPRLERTGAQPARHGRASVGAGRSTAGR